jgi:hypothetical protein
MNCSFANFADQGKVGSPLGIIIQQLPPIFNVWPQSYRHINTAALFAPEVYF